jgi:hypothetical protein
MAVGKQPFAWVPDRGFFWVFVWLEGVWPSPPITRRSYVGPFASLDEAWASRFRPD